VSGNRKWWNSLTDFERELHRFKSCRGAFKAWARRLGYAGPSMQAEFCEPLERGRLRFEEWEAKLRLWKHH
jgi:hypothetical protein